MTPVELDELGKEHGGVTGTAVAETAAAAALKLRRPAVKYTFKDGTNITVAWDQKAGDFSITDAGTALKPAKAPSQATVNQTHANEPIIDPTTQVKIGAYDQAGNPHMYTPTQIRAFNKDNPNVDAFDPPPADAKETDAQRQQREAAAQEQAARSGYYTGLQSEVPGRIAQQSAQTALAQQSLANNWQEQQRQRLATLVSLGQMDQTKAEKELQALTTLSGQIFQSAPYQVAPGSEYFPNLGPGSQFDKFTGHPARTGGTFNPIQQAQSSLGMQGPPQIPGMDQALQAGIAAANKYAPGMLNATPPPTSASAPSMPQPPQPGTPTQGGTSYAPDPTGMATPTPGGALPSGDPNQFMASIMPQAQAISKQTGIPAAAIAAIAANETGFGKYVGGNNLFGIKGSGPAGTFNSPTWESVNGQRQNINDNFRAYASPQQSMEDFANLVTTSPRYKAALGTSDPGAFAAALQQGGYATDPDWAKKIAAIANQYFGGQ